MALGERASHMAAALVAAGALVAPGALLGSDSAAATISHTQSTSSAGTRESSNHTTTFNCELSGMEGKSIAVIALPQTEPTGFAPVVTVYADSSDEVVAQSPNVNAVADIATASAQRTLVGANVIGFTGGAMVQVRKGKEIFSCSTSPNRAANALRNATRSLREHGPVTRAHVGPNGNIMSRQLPRRKR